MGVPNYVWEQPPPGGDVSLGTANSIFGVIIDSAGSISPVQPPIDPAHVAALRAAGRDDGTWDVVFAEAESVVRFPTLPRTVRLWHGIYDGTSWRDTVRMPLPRLQHLQVFDASSLARSGDSLAWAIRGGAQVDHRDVLLLERLDERWRSELLRTRTSAYAEPSYQKSLGLILAVVKPMELSLGNEIQVDENSLFIYTRNEHTWQTRQVIAGGNEPVHRPSFVRSEETTVLSFYRVGNDPSRAETQALIGSPNHWPDSAPLSISTGVEHFVAVVAAETRLWIMSRFDSNTAQHLLQIVALRDGKPVVVSSSPYPFTGGFNAAATTSSSLIISGPVRGSLPHEPPVSTLLLNMHVACPSLTS